MVNCQYERLCFDYVLGKCGCSDQPCMEMFEYKTCNGLTSCEQKCRVFDRQEHFELLLEHFGGDSLLCDHPGQKHFAKSSHRDDKSDLAWSWGTYRHGDLLYDF